MDATLIQGQNDLERSLRRAEKRLAKSEQRRAELEHLMDGSQAFQRRVIQEIQESKAEIERLYASLREVQARTDLLLRSIMPDVIVEELKASGKVRPRRIRSATVMFADFVSFTNSTENMDPVQLVEMLDTYYSTFDEIMTRNGVEKVKTIGDEYMCVAGNINGRGSEDHASQMFAAAKDLRAYVRKMRRSPDHPGGVKGWDVRVGLHSGPISTGVVGTERLSFDIWGDTVNTASRVVKACTPDDILFSQSTFLLLKDRSGIEPRADVEAKGKGIIAVYRYNPGIT